MLYINIILIDKTNTTNSIIKYLKIWLSKPILSEIQKKNIKWYKKLHIKDCFITPLNEVCFSIEIIKGTNENHAKNPKPHGCWEIPISVAEIIAGKNLFIRLYQDILEVL